MKAAFLYGPEDVRVEDAAAPRLIEPTDAIVRITASCVCGSDLHPYRKAPHFEHGRAMGHEFIGIVEATGADVTSVRPGGVISRVGVPQYVEAPVGRNELFMPNVTLTGGVAPVRAYMAELLPDVLDGTVEPGLVFDRELPLDEAPEAYRLMNEREALKVLLRP